MEGTTIAYILISIGLVILAGLMSGLTLGLLSLDSVDMEVLRRSGTDAEKKYAARIEPVIANTHLLLVTLLLTNAAAMEALPIFLDRLVSPTVAIILSVTAVLFFGEIIPQAACKSYGLAIGAWCAPLVRVLMFLVIPIGWPISKVLDYCLGEDHGALFRRGQLKALVDLHSTHEGMGGDLGEEEINVIRGALDLTGKQAMVAMTPLEKVFMLSADYELNESGLKKILASGHSRIPVHSPGNRSNILGIVLVKEMVLVDYNAKTKVSDVKLRSIPHLRGDVAAYDLLRLFQTGRSHMVALTRPSPQANGDADPDNPDAQQSLPNIPSKEEIVIDMEPRPSAETRASIDHPSTDNKPKQSAFANGGARPAISRANSFGEDDEGTPIGIVTIEDLIEELIGTEIVDETDQFVDNLRSQKVNSAMLMKGLPPRLRSLLMARQGSAVSAGPSTRNINIRTINAKEGVSPVRAGKTTDDKRSKSDIRQPLLDKAGDHGGSP